MIVTELQNNLSNQLEFSRRGTVANALKMRYSQRMDTENEYKTGDLARRFDVHANTVRDWSDRYGGLLSTRATAAKRTYTYEDALLLSTIAEMRDVGLSFDAIREALDSGQRAGFIPDAPTKAEQEARDSVALVPQPEYDRALDQVQRLQTELDRVTSERDKALAKLESETSDIRQEWRSDMDSLNSRIVNLEREKGIIEGQLHERPSVMYWLMVVVAIAASAVFITAAAVLILSGRAG